MKKLIGFILALILLSFGILGVYHFYKLEKAKENFEKALEIYKTNNTEKAINALNKILEDYNYPIVRAYVYLTLGDINYTGGKILKSVESYNQIKKDESLRDIKRIYYQAHVRLARIYRKLLQTGSIDKENEIILKKILELENLLKRKVSPAEYNFFNIRKVLYRLEAFAFNPDIDLPNEEDSIDQIKTEVGYLYLYTGNIERAESYFKEARGTYAKLGLARIYLTTGRREEGLKILYEIRDFDPTGRLNELYYEELFRYASDLFNKGFYEEAVFYFKKISGKFPGSSLSEESLYILAEYYYKRNEYDRALEYIDRLISNSIGIKDEYGFILKGIIMYDTGNFRRALKIFSEFLKRYPKSKKVSEVKDWKSLCERAIKYLN